MMRTDPVLITVNRRLSRWLQKSHGEQQLRLGQQAWSTPTILPYTTWLEQSWELLWDQPDILAHHQPVLLLNEHQERLLWQQIIAATVTLEEQPLFRAAAAVHDVMGGWRLLCEADLELTESMVMGHEDAMVFYGWQQQFRQRCQQQRWIDQGGLAQWLCQHADLVPWPSALTWVGFDQLTPIQQALIERLRQIGVKVTLSEAPDNAATDQTCWS
ncbi:MAG: hypothetical protein HQL58_08495, partial [Magnetococcales bacterium]|nr:hypothetical protein [Magnetococcales bacterium]